MKHTIILGLTLFSLLAFANNNERKDRRDDRQEDYVKKIDEKHKGGVVDKAEDVIDVDHKKNKDRRDDRRKDIKKK